MNRTLYAGDTGISPSHAIGYTRTAAREVPTGTYAGSAWLLGARGMVIERVRSREVGHRHADSGAGRCPARHVHAGRHRGAGAVTEWAGSSTSAAVSVSSGTTGKFAGYQAINARAARRPHRRYRSDERRLAPRRRRRFARCRSRRGFSTSSRRLSAVHLDNAIVAERKNGSSDWPTRDSIGPNSLREFSTYLTDDLGREFEFCGFREISNDRADIQHDRIERRHALRVSGAVSARPVPLQIRVSKDGKIDELPARTVSRALVVALGDPSARRFDHFTEHGYRFGAGRVAEHVAQALVGVFDDQDGAAPRSHGTQEAS